MSICRSVKSLGFGVVVVVVDAAFVCRGSRSKPAALPYNLAFSGLVHTQGFYKSN